MISILPDAVRFIRALCNSVTMIGHSNPCCWLAYTIPRGDKAESVSAAAPFHRVQMRCMAVSMNNTSGHIAPCMSHVSTLCLVCAEVTDKKKQLNRTSHMRPYFKRILCQRKLSRTNINTMKTGVLNESMYGFFIIYRECQSWPHTAHSRVRTISPRCSSTSKLAASRLDTHVRSPL